MYLSKKIALIAIGCCTLWLSSCKTEDNKDTTVQNTPTDTKENNSIPSGEEVEIIGPFASLLKKITSSPTQEALLLGIESNGKYKTVYIEYNEGKAERSVEVSALAVPQKDGFWFMQSASQKVTSYYKNDMSDNEELIKRVDNFNLSLIHI